MNEFYQKHCDRFIKVYPKFYDYFTASDMRLLKVTAFKLGSTIVMYAAYLTLMAYMYLGGIRGLWNIIIVPALVFVLVTVIRSGINAERPYEKYPVKPVIHKSTRGNSCPSRHTACAFAIAMAWLYANPPVGIAMLIIAAAIGISRPLFGVHFPLDVVFGAVLAIVISVIGYAFIPVI